MVWTRIYRLGDNCWMDDETMDGKRRGDKISSLFEIFARNWQTMSARGRCFVYPSIRTGIFEANGDWDEFERTMLR